MSRWTRSLGVLGAALTWCSLLQAQTFLTFEDAIPGSEPFAGYETQGFSIQPTSGSWDLTGTSLPGGPAIFFLVPTAFPAELTVTNLDGTPFRANSLELQAGGDVELATAGTLNNIVQFQTSDSSVGQTSGLQSYALDPASPIDTLTVTVESVDPLQGGIVVVGFGVSTLEYQDLGVLQRPGLPFVVNTFGDTANPQVAQDTEIAIYDANTQLVATGDTYPFPPALTQTSFQATLTELLPAGTYYLAVSRYNTAFGGSTLGDPGLGGGLGTEEIVINLPGITIQDTFEEGQLRYYRFTIADNLAPTEPLTTTELGTIGTVGDTLSLQLFNGLFTGGLGVYEVASGALVHTFTRFQSTQEVQTFTPTRPGRYLLAGGSDGYASFYTSTGSTNANPNFLLGSFGGTGFSAFGTFGELNYIGFEIAPDRADFNGDLNIDVFDIADLLQEINLSAGN
ncbi:MAG: hypothetical protein AAGI30_04390 [Planctomycetota bacterium]